MLQIIQFAHVSLMKMYNFVLFETLQCTPVNRKKPEELLLKDFYSYSFQLKNTHIEENTYTKQETLTQKHFLKLL